MHTIERITARATRLTDAQLVDEYTEAIARQARALDVATGAGSDDVRRASEECDALRSELFSRLTPPF